MKDKEKRKYERRRCDRKRKEDMREEENRYKRKEKWRYLCKKDKRRYKKRR
jgi:hypothetical protein